jgi:hypothetical protein
MAYGIGFGGGGSPSSNRGFTGATYAVTYSMFGYPSGNTNLSGSVVVANNGVSLNGSFSGGYTGAYWDSSGNVVVTSDTSRTNITGYIGNGYTMYAPDISFSWNGGFQGTAYWSTVPTAPQSIGASVSGRNVTVTIAGSGSDGGSGITSYTVQWSNDNSSWANNQDISSGTYTYTNLAGGKTYYFRAYANNGNGSSQATSTSVFVPAGGKRWDGAAWQITQTAKRWDGSSWVALNTAKRWSGSAWVDLS